MNTESLPENTPFINRLSFRYIIEDLEKRAASGNTAKARIAQEILNEIEPYPLLKEGFEDLDLIDTYRPQIDLLMEELFPEILTRNEIKAAVPPMYFMPFYLSKRLQALIDNSGDEFEFNEDHMESDTVYIMRCSLILAKFYGFPLDMKRSLMVEIPDVTQNMPRQFKMTFNADMLEIKRSPDAHEISEADYLKLMDNFQDIELWRQYFPPGSYVISGLGLISFTDVSIEHTVSDITSNLLERSNDSLDQVETNLQHLFRISNLKAHVMVVEGESLAGKAENGRQLSMGTSLRASSKELLGTASHQTLIVNHEPLVIMDIDRFAELSNAPIAKNLKASGMKSFIAYPLVYNDKLVAIFEIASPKKNDLNSGSVNKLDLIAPMLSMTANQFIEQRKIKMEAIIQEECTTIHPSVKWKFEKEAFNYLSQKNRGIEAHFQDIVFKDIYPFFGQLDIRSSSTLRNRAVEADLGKQLNGVLKVLDLAIESKGLPIYQEMRHRVRTYKRELEAGIQAGSEHQILSFLTQKLYPIFEHMQEVDSELALEVARFQSSLDPELKIIYDQRRNFDESVMATNHALANFLDKRQEEAQKMFPHYFERYKTDGVEFNMYLGQSIADGKVFDPIYIHNLRLWQLIVMCEMEHEFHELRKSLKTPLEVASLILVNNSPLSINFRMDEKRFDVDGAYNARYEIIKKRVDKAHIKGTGERLTKPGKIAIIYTSNEDVREYQGYINFLQYKGLLEPSDPEVLELEDLPGVTGLKALRVSIKYGKTDLGATISHEEIKEIVEAQ